MNDFVIYCKNRIKYGLFKFLFYLIIACILFFAIDKLFVSAATYTPANYKAQLYDNIDGSLTAVDTSLENNDYYYGFIGLTAYTSGGAWGISSPIPLIANHTYSMTVDPFAVGCGYTILSSVNRIGVGTSMSNAKSSYENNTNVTEKFSQAVSNSRYLQYVFTPSINASYIVFPYATTSTCSSTTNQLSNIVIEDLGETGVSQDQINTSLTNQTNELNISIQESTDTITGAITDTQETLEDSIQSSQDNINSNIDEMEDAIVESNKETQDVIKDQFNSCRPSVNLFDESTLITGYFNSDHFGNMTENNSYRTIKLFLKAGTYTLSIYSNDIYLVREYLNGEITSIFEVSSKHTFTLSSDRMYGIYFRKEDLSEFTSVPRIQINEGSTVKTYEPYGEVCSNKMDETNDTLKGGFSSIGNWFTELGDKIGGFFDNLLNGILDGLKQLFIPEDGYFENWFNTLKLFFEEKLGFLATPFTIIIDFVNRYLSLDSGADIIINIPDITVPNFENHKIISATSLNWSQLLKSKESLNTLWQLYLSFIDVFLILNFINLCENKYNRIFGGDTTNYEYYTVEDSYTYDQNTGEVKSARRNERTTTRKKVNS